MASNPSPAVSSPDAEGNPAAAAPSQQDQVSRQRISFSAVHHWSMYGNPSTASATATTFQDWKTVPFSAPSSAAWDVPLTAEQLAPLARGFKPSEMEEKWFVCSALEGHAEGPVEQEGGSESENNREDENVTGEHSKGRQAGTNGGACEEDGIKTLNLHMYRSWTGYEMVRLRILVTVMPRSAASETNDERSGGAKEEPEEAGTKGEDNRVVKEARIVSVMFETDPEKVRGGGEDFAKKTALSVCHWVLGVDVKDPAAAS